MAFLQEVKPQTVDFALEAKWLATVNNCNDILENTSLIIKDDQILDILPTKQARTQYCAAEVLCLSEHLVMPGLVNAHGHAAMSLLRGYADDYPLQEWLEQHIWPAEGEFIGTGFVYDGTHAAVAEMLATGTTCFADMYFFPEAAARAIDETGMRAYLAPPVFDFPTQWQVNPEGYLSAINDLAVKYANHDLITVAIGPHAPYTVSDGAFEQIVSARDALQSGIQVHCHETAKEVEDSLELYNKRPLQRLNDLGLITNNTQLVHMTQVTGEDIEILNKHCASVIHCPKSNLKLASGFCPAQELINAGVNVALGTDSAASNNDLDMLSEMQFAALIAKGASGNPESINANTALRMATINGAKALGLDGLIGSLEKGKQADIVAVDMSDNNLWPIYSPLSALVYNQSGQYISDVWIAGKRKVKNGTLVDINQTSLKNTLHSWQTRIKDFKNHRDLQ